MTLTVLEAEAREKEIHLTYGPDYLNISFHRTIRIPDSSKASALPPSLGRFGLHLVSDYAESMPPQMAKKGGVFFPMYQNEAMWINFYASGPFAIKIFAGHVNVVSGESRIEDEATKRRQAQKLSDGETLQDYIVAPCQRWIDGIAVGNGMVRQFVATPVGSGYSVEAQITGQESVAGLQFEVIPKRIIDKASPSEVFDICVQSLTGKRTLLEVQRDDTIYKIKEMIQGKEGIPVGQQRLIQDGRQLQDDKTLKEYYIPKGCTIHLILKLRGGGYGPPPDEMAIAAGSLIKQEIHKDTEGMGVWADMAPISLNVQILNSAIFEKITGLSNPQRPISAAHYAAAGLPFFHLPEQPSGISGNFDKVKSVAQMFSEHGLAGQERSYEYPLVWLNKDSSTRFRPVAQLEEELLQAETCAATG